MFTVVSVAGVQFYEEEIPAILESSKKYLVNYRGVYEIRKRKTSSGFYGKSLLQKKGLTRRGRFFLMDRDSVNKLLGFDLIGEGKKKNESRS